MTTSRRPYLIRAMYDWLVDNDFSPHLLVDIAVEGVQVPPGYAQDGKIVLNVSPTAVRGLSLENDGISFEARFSGRAMTVWVPVHAVLAIYARENGEGMMLQGLDDGDTPPDPNPPTPPTDGPPEGGDDTPPKGTRRGHLKVVK
ncbi:ClpXP protease specificity-enhancing factor [Abyssibacter profundi]|nr:ClpXP protease specificity-enhancing factor [Abyssibacter profundi]